VPLEYIKVPGMARDVSEHSFCTECQINEHVISEDRKKKSTHDVSHEGDDIIGVLEAPWTHVKLLYLFAE